MARKHETTHKYKYRYRLMTTRFTNDTYYELQRYKENNNIQNKCIYNIPIKLRFTRVPMSYPMIVLEMNNTTNKIEGMGFILNETHGSYYQHRVYNNMNYNRFTYKSRFYINLQEEHPDYRNIVRPNPEFVSCIQTLTRACFFGKGHLKRGSSFTTVPKKHVTEDMNKHLMDMFLLKYQDESNFLLNLTIIKELKEETKKKILEM